METLQHSMPSTVLSYKRVTVIMVLSFMLLSVIFFMVIVSSSTSIFDGFPGFAVECNGDRFENVSTSFQVDTGNASTNVKKLSDEVLLYGLLNDGFDQRTCISRYRSLPRRKKSPLHKPSSYLVSELRKYEALHRQCGPYTESYNRTLRLLKSSHMMNDPTMQCNYVAWVGGFNGLGNRIISMTSAFLYAMLTNRVLIVDHGPDMSDLFCEPFLNTSWLLPEQFGLRNQFHDANSWNVNSFGSIVKKNKSGSETRTSFNRSFVLVHIAHDSDDADKLFFSNRYQYLIKNVPWLVVKSDQYFVPSLFQIPCFKQELNLLFPDKETVFHNLGRYLFHPSNKVWGVISRYYQAYLAKADTIIGVQIRLFHPDETSSKEVVDEILSCTRRENVLPQVVEDRENQESTNQSSKAIVITSLNSRYYDSIKSMYWLKPTVTGELISVHQPSHEDHQHFGDNMHNIKAWAEMNILSLSDVLLTSSWSTFGYVAQGLAGLKPLILFFPDNGTPQLTCRRAVSMEPCYHYPPKSNDVSRVKQCEDVGFGIKLVNEFHH